MTRFADECFGNSQTKPVDLQVLVVKSSFEDALLQRRAQLFPEGEQTDQLPRIRSRSRVLTASISFADCATASTDFAKRAKAPQQDAELRGLLQEARYLDPRDNVQREELLSNSWGRVNLFRSDP